LGELELVDAIVDGRRPLRVERGAAVSSGPAARSAPDTLPTAHARALATRSRPGFDLAPVMLTWQLAVWVIAAADVNRLAFAAVPGRVVGRFLRRLDRGLLDETLVAYLANRPAGRTLTARNQTANAGLFDSISARSALLAAELPVSNPGAAA
jgi:hypothetical protein